MYACKKAHVHKNDIFTKTNVILVLFYKEFVWEDQSRKQCYIADIELDKAVIEPEMHEQCYIG